MWRTILTHATLSGFVFSRPHKPHSDVMTMRITPRYTLAWLFLAATALFTLTLIGCGKKHKVAPATPPPPVYTGPGFLRGTIGSMARLRGYEPMLVSGWGLVVNLHGTGSTSAPAFIRQWLINQMRLEGVGSNRLATSGNPMATLTPAQIIADPNTAVVEVFGLIPPGAPKGTRFDLFVSAVEGTQTTSLEHGELLPSDLSIGGSNRQMRFTKKQAGARGPLYVSPGQPVAQENDPIDSIQRRKAVVIAGGMVTEARRIELVLNQPSWQRSRDIADRINERFPRDAVDLRDTAIPSTDLLININIPARYNRNPEVILGLISNLFIQRQENFELVKAQQLADVLAAGKNEQYADDIALAWEALGKPALPVLQRLYDHATLLVAMTALEAGARLGDERAVDRLTALADNPDPQHRRHVATTLGYLPNSIRGGRAGATLTRMLDDADDSVRLAAYESLVNADHPVIQRIIMGEYEVVKDPVTRKERRQLKPESFKFALDLVPSKRPLVYAAQTHMPRLVIFDLMLEFKAPLLAQLWDNHLMLRAEAPSSPVSVFFQPFGQPKARTIEIAPTPANLAFLMAHKPTIENPTDGLDLSYSQVVQAIHELCSSGVVPSPMIVEESQLIKEVEQMVRQLPIPQRPDTEEQATLPADDNVTPPASPGFIDLPTQRSEEPPQP